MKERVESNKNKTERKEERVPEKKLIRMEGRKRERERNEKKKFEFKADLTMKASAVHGTKKV